MQIKIPNINIILNSSFFFILKMHLLQKSYNYNLSTFYIVWKKVANI